MISDGRWARPGFAALLCVVLLPSCKTMPGSAKTATPPSALESLIPLPEKVEHAGGAFTLAADSRIAIDPATPELEGIGRFLADRLKPATGLQLPVRPAAGAPARAGEGRAWRAASARSSGPG